MTGPLEFVEAAHKQAEQVAFGVEETWCAVDTPFGPEVRIGTGDDVDGKWSRESLGVDAAYRCDDPYDDCDSARAGYLAEAQLIAEHGNPAAVLRRVAAERKILDLMTRILDPDWGYGKNRTAVELAELTVRALAEGWGWQAAG